MTLLPIGWHLVTGDCNSNQKVKVKNEQTQNLLLEGQCCRYHLPPLLSFLRYLPHSFKLKEFIGIHYKDGGNFLPSVN